MAYFASLPMYDMPEIRTSTDTFWRYLSESMQDHGIGKEDLPHQLIRGRNPHDDWQRSDLVFSQTCGLPYVRDLRGQVTLLGSPAYDIDCAPGSYFSLIIAHQDSDEPELDERATGRFAYNDKRSQSGFAAYFSTLHEHGITKAPSEMIESGAHLQSIEMIADKQADIAAIDAVTFALALRHLPAAKHVKAFARSEVTPGLPYIAGLQFAGQREMIINAIVGAMAGLPEGVRDDLMITGFNDRIDTDYDGIREKWEKLADQGLYDI
jgi:ABC-type phosphate/phosphonate transport system substrate-binding protein